MLSKKIHIENTLTHRCLTCRRPNKSCLCEHLTPIDTNTKFVILMHPKEYKKEKIATGRLTHLQLKNSEIIVGIDFSHNTKLNQLIETHNSFVLYPNSKSINLSEIEDKKPKEFNKNNLIIIIDSTWYLAKKMFRLSSNLHNLNSISFSHNKKSQFKVKQQPYPNCLSTIESVQVVLEELNRLSIEDCHTQSFLKPFQKMVEFQVECLENPPANSYRSGEGIKLQEKNQYKSNKARNLFYNPSKL